jgi:catechol 2,3-dioxygenase-like lactoylglutathione lyase family enzyme
MLANAPVAAVLPCIDLVRARRFYGQTLGLSEIPLPTPRGADDQSAAGAMFRCGGETMIFVYARETPTQADHTAAGWIVDNFDAVADELLSRGITFETYPDMPGIEWDDRGVAFSPDGNKGAWFKDPDGNILSITEMPA